MFIMNKENKNYSGDNDFGSLLDKMRRKVFIEKPVTTKALKLRSKICEVGINDSDYMNTYVDTGTTMICPYYERWSRIIVRCYDKNGLKKYSSYKNCYVCDEWLTLSNFKAWMKKQDWKNKQIDKDIMITGNKVYGPDTCIFVTQEINKLVMKTPENKRKLPKGVKKYREKFEASFSLNGKYKHIGYFETPEEASNAYKKEKSKHVLEVANKQSEPLKGYLKRISNEILNS